MDLLTSVVKLVAVSGGAASRRPYYILFVIDSQIDLRLPGRATRSCNPICIANTEVTVE